MTYWIVALALLWLALAASIAVLAARRFRLAEDVLGAARANAAMLELTPARPLVFRADRRIEADARLVRELGLQGSPSRLAELSGNDSGIAAEDLDALAGEIEAARVSAAGFRARSGPTAPARVFEVRGGPAPAPAQPGTLLLWFFDTSAGEEERSRLAIRLRQTEAALNSLTHLIEAAPFPMWYRGPDLKLGLVNSAFVHAVEAKDASEVIERGFELIDGEGENSAAATARKAQESGPHRLADAAGDPARRAADAADRQRAAVDRRGRRLRGRRPGPGGRAGRACPAHGIAARAGRPDDRRHRPVRRRPQPELLQPAVRGDGRARSRMARRQPGVRPRARADARGSPAARDARLPGMEERAARLVHQRRGSGRGGMDAAQRRPYPGRRAAASRRRPRLFLEDRTEQLRLASARDTLLRVRAATFDNLFEAISVFASDGRLYLWNRRFLEDWELDEDWLAEHPRVDELVPAMARKLVNPTAAAQIREMVRQTTNERQSVERPHLDDRRAALSVRRGSAARRQRAVHDGRRDRFEPHRGGASRARRRRSRRRTGSRPISSPT